jgi:hypothetical protein
MAAFKVAICDLEAGGYAVTICARIRKTQCALPTIRLHRTGCSFHACAHACAWPHADGLSGSQSPQASPGFLIHDSTIFDGVDERQRALALELVASESQAQEFLYICTWNSDYIPRNEVSSGFRIEDYIRLRLTDANVAGCLMGVRF